MIYGVSDAILSCKKCGKEPANPFVGRHMSLFKK